VLTCQRSNVPEKYGREVRVDLKEARKRAEELIKFGFGIADMQLMWHLQKWWELNLFHVIKSL